MAEPPREFAQQLRSLREAQGLSVRDLAEIVGVSKVTIWKWEKGASEPRARLIPPLARALAVTPVQLRPALTASRKHVEQPHPEERSQADDLAEVIAKAKQMIADASGVGAKHITISIEY